MIDWYSYTQRGMTMTTIRLYISKIPFTQNFDPSKMDKIWLADRFQKVVTTLNVDLLDLDTISANPCSLAVYQGHKIAVASSYTEPLVS